VTNNTGCGALRHARHDDPDALLYKKDGKVYIIGMNTGLMGKMFGGTITRVMGGKVSADEKAILGQVVRK
jgi:hypothetical protein